MSEISTHVLDLSRGVPAAGVDVTLAHADSAGHFAAVGRATTDTDGRIGTFGTSSAAHAGRYRLTFRVAEYFVAHGAECFFPEVQVLFEVRHPEQRHHVPLLLTPYGYSTYRGS
ncbi:MAG: hydroxyisourate hydrolase [Gemmatimonadales bacterium]